MGRLRLLSRLEPRQSDELRLVSAGSLMQVLAMFLLLLGAQTSQFPDGVEYILTTPSVVISVWVGTEPGPGQRDSLNVLVIG